MIDWKMSELVPHAGEMLLLDEVLSFDADTLRARARVRPDGPLHADDGRVPPWIALEFMAQAVAAWAGCQARVAGRAVELGFLLGTRRFDCRFDALPAGMELIVDVRRCLQDESGIGVFECRLTGAGALLAEARLNVYSPRDASAFVQEPLAAQEQGSI